MKYEPTALLTLNRHQPIREVRIDDWRCSACGRRARRISVDFLSQIIQREIVSMGLRLILRSIR
jgi:hypothetical protein